MTEPGSMAIRPTVRTISASAWRSIRTASILDCAFSVVERGGRQHCFYGSRRAPIERTEMQVGPFRLEVLEPMRRTRVVLDDNAHGPVVRSDLLRAHGRYPGGAPDPLVERPSRRWTRPASTNSAAGAASFAIRTVRSRWTINHATAPRIAPGAFATSVNGKSGGAPMPPPSVSSSGPRCSGTTTSSHAIFFDGTRGEALVREGFDRAALSEARMRSPASSTGSTSRMATARHRVKYVPNTRLAGFR